MNVRLHDGLLHQVLSVSVISAHAKRVAVEQTAQRDDLTAEVRTQFQNSRNTVANGHRKKSWKTRFLRPGLSFA